MPTLGRVTAKNYFGMFNINIVDHADWRIDFICLFVFLLFQFYFDFSL